MERTARPEAPVHRSPLPPVLPGSREVLDAHAALAGRTPGKRRFSVHETAAFGHRPFARCSPERHRDLTRRPSLPNLQTRSSLSEYAPESRLSPEPETRWSSAPASRACSPEVSLPDILDQSLPLLSQVCGSRSSPSLPRASSLRAVKARAQQSGESLPVDALERFRSALLRRFRSLHDAFAPLHKRGHFARSLNPGDFRHAVSRIDEGAFDELAAAVGMRWPLQMHMSDFFERLIDSSLEGLLWEFGGGLVRRGLWPKPTRVALEYAGRHLCGLRQKNERPLVGVLNFGSMISLDDDGDDDGSAGGNLQPSAGSSDAQQRLLELLMTNIAPRQDRVSWQHFCDFLGLTLLEANKMFGLFASGNLVELATVLEALRVTVSPSMSLQRFARRAISKHGSLRRSFRVAVEEGAMCWQDFRRLAHALEISERAAGRLWAVLASQHSVDIEDADAVVVQVQVIGRIDLDNFVQRLAKWGACGVLDRWKQQLLSHFGSLQEARRALRACGIPSGSELLPERLDEAHCALSIVDCDPDSLLLAARQALGSPSEPVSAAITLDDVVDVMRSVRPGHEGPAGDEMCALRRQLRDVRCRGSSLERHLA